MNINKWTRGKSLTNRLVFAGGDPLFRWTPKVVKWGPNISLYWLGTELVWLGKEASMALSNRDCRHGRQIGKCADCALDHMEMAADAEARRVDELTALRKQDTELIRQLVEALESVDGAMPFPVARQVLKVARARLEGKP